MKIKFWQCLILLVAAFGAQLSIAAQQRPLLTEDVDIIPPGSVRLGVGVDFLQNARFPISGLRGDLTRVGDVRVHVGLAPNVEVELNGVVQQYLDIDSQTLPSPIPLTVDPLGNSTNDVGDFTLSTKIKLRNETGVLPSLGFKFGVQLPNTDQRRGLGTNQVNAYGIVLVGKKFGKRYPDRTRRVSVFGNVGIGILPTPTNTFAQNDVLLYGLAGIVKVNNRFNIVSEINGRQSTRGGTAPLGTESLGEFRLGTQIRASGLRFDAAAVFGTTRNSPRTGLTFGVTYQSPSIFEPAQ